MSVPESRYLQSPEEADALAETLERTLVEVRRIAKKKRDAEAG